MKRPERLIPRDNGFTAIITCKVCGFEFQAPRFRKRQVCSRQCNTTLTLLRHRREAAADGVREARKAEHSERVKNYWQQGRYDHLRGPKPLTEEQKKERRMSRALKAAAKGVTLGPNQVAKMRGEIAAAVADQLEQAHKAVMGTGGVTWSPTQARIFGMLLNKVLPDLHASQIQSAKRDDITSLTRDELEQIVAEARTIEAEAVTPDDDIEDAELSEDDRP